MLRIRTLLGGLFALLFGLTLTAGIILSQVDKQAVYQKLAHFVSEQSAWRLAPDGRLSWSFLPLGIRIEQLRATHATQAHEIAIDEALLELNWLPLLSGTVQTRQLHLSAPHIQWQRNQAAEQTLPHQPPAQQKPAPSADQHLAIELRAVHIENGHISLLSSAQQEEWTINKLSLDLANWQDQSPSPVVSRFELIGAQLPDALRVTASATITTHIRHSSLTLGNLSLSIEGSDAAPGSLYPLHLDGAATWQDDTLRIDSLNLRNAHLNVRSSLHMTLSPKPKGEARIQASVTGAEALISALGGPANLPLKHVKSLSALRWEDHTYTMQLQELLLDGERWQGALRVAGTTPQFNVQLQGERFDLRPWLHYLNNTSASNAPSAARSQASSAPPGEPFEFPELHLSAELSLDHLLLPRGEIHHIAAQLSSDAQHVHLQSLSFEAAEGRAEFSAQLHHENWPWRTQLTGSAQNIALKALNDLVRAEPLPLQGRANLQIELSAQSAQPQHILSSLAGTGRFAITEGKVAGINLQHLTCLTYAQFNREPLNTPSWPAETRFESLSGELTLHSGTLSIPQLNLNSATLRGEGKSTITLDPAELNATLALYANGAHPDPACRVNPRIARLPLPATCTGTWSPNTIKCNVDSRTLLGAAKHIAKDEAQRKAEKELDRALEKNLGNQPEAREAVKSLLKGIFQ